VSETTGTSLQEALVVARQRSAEIGARIPDSGQAHRDVVLLRLEQAAEVERDLIAAGFDVEWFTRGTRYGYLLPPDTKSMGYGRLCAVLELRDALREAGYGADVLHRDVA
jgi:hypothetical protein